MAAIRRVSSPKSRRSRPGRLVHYTEEAEADLVAIAERSEAEFGAEQCELYLQALEEACEHMLPQFPAIARIVPKRPTLRYWRCERHVIYFRIVPDGLEVVRILHERMLPDLHLQE